MLGLYIFVGLLMGGMVTLIVLKIRSSRTAKVVARGRAEKIEDERIESLAKTEARGKN